MATLTAIRPKRTLATAGALVFAVLAFGFVMFAAYATRQSAATPATADAIVVLTGGEQRIVEGARLLQAGKGRRLLISGVNRRNSREDILRLTGLSRQMFDCCVDLGYQALDTIGNADETRLWTEAWGFNRLIVVTASYHMPRSLTEIGRVMPTTRIVPHPVIPKNLRTEPWWLSVSASRTLLAEYLKLLPSAAMYAATRLIHLGEPATAAAGRQAHRPVTG